MDELTVERLSRQLRPFVPGDSVDILARWINKYHIQFTVTKSRKSVYGDYHWPKNGKGHRISVNGDLNKYAFLITAVHELAHLTTWEKFRNTVSSHGGEWKEEFRLLMDEFSGRKIFPLSVRAAFKKHLLHPKHSHCDDPELMNALRKYDWIPAIHLQDLDKEELFEYTNGRVFRKGEKLRKRIKCYEVKTNRIYLFSPTAPVKVFNTDRY